LNSNNASPAVALRGAPVREPLIDLAKVLASQFIVWHHLAVYGPMSDVVHGVVPGLIDWLYRDARLAVQVFLVIGGFLAARTLWPLLGAPQGFSVPLLVWRRYLRLVRPYAVALLAALAAAALARLLMDHPATPAAPTLPQLVAHLLLLQDVFGLPGLSAGVWYVAIDFQLFALLVLLVWAARALGGLGRLGRTTDGRAAWLLPLACAALTLGSLLWINRQPGWDMWAPYFFGAYGLGVCVQALVQRSTAEQTGSRAAARWASSRAVRRRLQWAMLGLVTVVLLALCVEWRPRILVAGLTAAMLLLGAQVRTWPRWLAAPGIAAMARMSYAQFLVHYPVCLATNAVLTSHWPDHPAINALGMLCAWLLSLAAAAVFRRQVELGGWRKMWPVARLPGLVLSPSSRQH
jgi:peptidoglycan/LPS O-acetylase OafA/YrhL